MLLVNKNCHKCNVEMLFKKSIFYNLKLMSSKRRGAGEEDLYTVVQYRIQHGPQLTISLSTFLDPNFSLQLPDLLSLHVLDANGQLLLP